MIVWWRRWSWCTGRCLISAVATSAFGRRVMASARDETAAGTTRGGGGADAAFGSADIGTKAISRRLAVSLARCVVAGQTGQGTSGSMLDRTRGLVTAVIAAIALATATVTFASAPTASADPICGAPGMPPCAGPSPLTPDQQCAYLAWRSMMPCNWLGMQVPAGTPGSWDNPPAPPPP